MFLYIWIQIIIDACLLHYLKQWNQSPGQTAEHQGQSSGWLWKVPTCSFPTEHEAWFCCHGTPAALIFVMSSSYGAKTARRDPWFYSWKTGNVTVKCMNLLIKRKDCRNQTADTFRTWDCLNHRVQAFWRQQAFISLRMHPPTRQRLSLVEVPKIGISISGGPQVSRTLS